MGPLGPIMSHHPGDRMKSKKIGPWIAGLLAIGLWMTQTAALRAEDQRERRLKEAITRDLEPTVVQIRTKTGTGSGFLIDGIGLIMTNAHVIDGQQGDQVGVRFTNGDVYPATVWAVGKSEGRDIAVVRIA